jgi:hypothetical protein
MYHQQLDLPRYRGDFYTIPSDAPGRLGHNDYITFSGLENIYKEHYHVAIESVDVSGPPLRIIGPLSEKVLLPQVWLPADGKLFVLPTTENLPSFCGHTVRGSHYIIPRAGRVGQYQLQRFGLPFLP